MHKPATIAAEARPPIISTRPLAMKSIEIDSGGPVMPRSKSRATVRSVVSAGVFQVAHAGRPDAGFGQPVVEPGRGAVAEVGADGVVDRIEDLQKHEDAAGERERHRQRVAASHSADQDAHRDGERGGQQPEQ